MIPRHHFNILCVDDNEAILGTLRAAFKLQGTMLKPPLTVFSPFRKSEKIRSVLGSS
jgi:hypothetical protein